MRVVVGVGQREMRWLTTIFAVAGVAFVVMALFMESGGHAFALLGILCLVGAGTVHISHREPTPVLSADADGIRLLVDEVTPWDDVQAVVLLERTVSSADGDDIVGFVVLTSAISPSPSRWPTGWTTTRAWWRGARPASRRGWTPSGWPVSCVRSGPGCRWSTRSRAATGCWQTDGEPSTAARSPP